MNETFVGTIPLIGLIILAIGCWFYMLGGRSDKWRRRFIGSLICATAVWIESLIYGVFNFWLLVDYPLVIGQFVLGYGASITYKKVIKRSIVAVTSVASGLIMCIIFSGKAWLLLPIDVIVGVVSIWLGVKNPVPAPVEEFFICLFTRVTKLIYPFAGTI